ncbi:MAG: DUF6677 family protein [Planctomycetota bacterium]
MERVNATDAAGESEPTAGGGGSGARWHLTAALGTWLVPGLGHWMIGQRLRGAVLGVTIGLLYVGGLFIGGIGVIDRAAPLPGFFGQMFVGPSFVVMFAAERLEMWSDIDGAVSLVDGSPIGVMAEQGVLYTSVAGMLNLLCMIDVVYRVGDRAAGGAGGGLGDGSGDGGAG